MGSRPGPVDLSESLNGALYTLDAALERMGALMRQVDASWPLEAALQENYAEARGACAEARALAIALRDALRLAGGGKVLQEGAPRRLRIVGPRKGDQIDAG